MLKFCSFLSFSTLLLFLFLLPLSADVYYVDQNHAQASDSNSGGESDPWRTVRKAASTAEAGDTVYVKNGTYYERVVFKNSGTSSAYITVKAFPGHSPIINGRDNAQWDGLINFSGVDYIKFEGFIITNCGTGQGIYIIHKGGNPATYIELTGLQIDNIDDSGVQIRGNSNNILVENCTMFNCNWSAVDASQYSGGRPHHIVYREITAYSSNYGLTSEQADDLLVENNTIRDCDIGIDIGSGKRNVIRGNSITDCADGIALSSNTDSEIYDNKIKNANEAMYAYYWSAHGEPHRNNKWYRNIVINATWAFYEMDRKNSKAATGPTSGHEYYNNVFYKVGGNSYRSVFWFRGVDDFKFYHNTIYTKDSPNNEVFQLTSGAQNGSFKNNIVSLSGHNGLFNINDGSSAAIDYNCYHNRNGSVSAVGSNDIVADPLFLNPDSNDFHLQKNSPCIDAGTDVGITEDFEGNSRPLGDGFDLGAYEYDPATAIFFKNNNPSEFRLSQNYPNPFSARGGSAFGGNPVTTIRYTLPTYCHVELSIYDVTGKNVRLLVDQHQEAGEHRINFRASGLASGVYFYKLRAGPIEQAKKMLLIQ